jgi:hypothetical protein
MRRTLGIGIVGLVLALVTLPLAVHADEGRPEGAGPLPVLTNLLEKLNEELVTLQGRVAEADRPLLEKELTRAIDLLEKLLDELGTPPQSDEQKPSLKEELGKFDIALHRLIQVLKRVVAPAAPSPEREKAKETLAELRTWGDGYLAGATARMDPREAKEFERMTRTLLGKVAETLAGNLRQAAPEPSALEVLLHRLQGLVARLDQVLVRTFGPRPLVPSSPKP